MDCQHAYAGEIVSLAGVDAGVTDTVCHPDRLVGRNAIWVVMMSRMLIIIIVVILLLVVDVV